LWLSWAKMAWTDEFSAVRGVLIVLERHILTMRSVKRATISLLLLILLWVPGCQNVPSVLTPDRPVASPTPSPDDQTVTPTAEPALSTPELPAGPYPPRIVTYAPRRGEVVAADATLSWTFDQALDRESFAAGLRFTPLLDGELVWLSDREVSFEPAVGKPSGLEPGTRYSVVIDAAKVTSAGGLPMGHDVMYTFSALSPLQVTWVSPPDGAVGLRGDTSVLVEFNHEIVPETCVDRESVELGECPTLPLAFTPSVMGRGAWLNTSLYRYEVLGGFVSGMVHGVVLDAGVVSLDGAVLAEPYGWSFETELPQVVEVSPASGQVAAALDTDIRVIFNTPMDAQVTGGALTVANAGGVPVAGAITWRDDGAELVFSPFGLLESDTVYQVRIGERARAVRSTPLVSPPAWGFRTVPAPDVLSYLPDDGAEDVGLDTPVRISFAGAIDAASLQAGISVSSSLGLEDVFDTYDAAAGVYTLVWDRRPRTEYCVSVTDYVTDDYGRALTTPAGFCFETGDLPEVLALPAEADVVSLTADRPSALNLVAQNVAAASFSLSEVDVPAVTGADPSGGEVLRRWSEAFDLTPNTMEPVTVTLRRLGGALPTGLYQLAWQLPGDTAPARPVSVAVVDRHVLVKLSESEAVVWVADLATGSPVTRTEVQLLDADGLLIAGGTTDADGLAWLSLPTGGALGDVLVAITGQPGAEGFGFALTTSRNSVAPWEFGIRADLGPQPPARAFVHVDRPVTLPGQRVQISGFVREDLGGEYRPLRPGESITLTLRGPDEAVVDQRSLPLSETGRFGAAIFLSESLPAGVYAVDVLVAAPGQGAGQVTLASAAITVIPGGRPEFAVHVTPEEADIVEGATARFVVQTDDLAGGGVGGAALAWSVYAEPYEFAPTVGAAAFGATADDWVWQLPTGEVSSRLVAKGTAVAGSNGRYVLELPATLASLTGDSTAAPAGAPGGAGSQLWRVEVVALDSANAEALGNAQASGAAAVGTGSLTVHASETYLGLLPKSQVVRVKERLAIDLLMVDWLGNGLREQEVLLQLERRMWTQRPEDGLWVHTDTMVSEQTVTTSGSGIVSVAFTAPRSGTYVVKAASVAAGGKETRVEAVLWVGGAEDGDWLVSNAKLGLVADQPSYQVGDVARVLVPASFEGPYELLLTIERDGIMAVERLTVEEPNPILEIPVLDTHVPNVYVSCVLLLPGNEMRPPHVYVGYLNLPVASPDQHLTVEVMPTGTLHAPGDAAEVLIRTLDRTGQPVSADVTLAVMEETASRAVGSGAASLADAFHGERSLRVLTGDALLAPGNPGPGRSSILAHTVPIPGVLGGAAPVAGASSARGEVPTSAYWNANLRTDTDGEVVVAFALPEAQTTWAVTAWAITAKAAVGQGRATLSTEKPLSVQPITPRYFVAGDRAEIAASVHNGTGEGLVVDVELAEAQGLTVEGINLRRMTLAAGETKRVAWPVLVATSGARELGHQNALEFGELGHQNALEFGTVAARIVARSGDTIAVGVLTDAVTGAAGLPVHQLSPLDTFAVSGALDAEAWVEVFDVPEDAGDATTLVVHIDATLGSFLADSLMSNVRSMDLGLPDTTGAWVDELLPAVSIYGALHATGRESTVAETAVPALVAALERTYARQNDDGGWGWVLGSDESDLYLTSDVALALLRAREAGFPVREEILEAALAWVAFTLDEAVAGGARQVELAFAIRVLSEAREPWPQGVGATLYADRGDLGLAGRAHLAMAFSLVDPSDTRVVTLLDELRAAAITNATGTTVHWEEMERANPGVGTPSGSANSGIGMPSSSANPQGSRAWVTHVQVSALALDVFATLFEDAAEVPGAVAWLMSARQGTGWRTSHETAWALTALADTLVRHGDVGSESANAAGSADPGIGMPSGSGVVIRLNGVEVPVVERAEMEDGADSMSSGTLRLTMGGDSTPMLQPGRNVLEILRARTSERPATRQDAGEDLVYTTVQLDTALPIEQGMVPESRGLTLTRRYCALPVGAEVCVPVSSVARGDLVTVRLLVTVPETRYAVRLEDPIPAGFELADVAPSVSQSVRVGGATIPKPQQDNFLWVGSRGDRAVFFAPELSPGTYEVAYVMKAVFAGSYAALPAVAGEVHFADIVARTTVATLIVASDQEGR